MMGGIETPRNNELPPQAANEYYNNPERREADAQNQATFIGAVEKLNPNLFGLLPDLQEATDHRGSRSISVKEVLENNKASALLHPNIHSSLTDGELSFNPRPLLRLGREDSRRQVFFGEMTGIGYGTEGNPSTEVAVSIIPDENDFINHERSLHEIAMYQYVASLDIPTLDIVGVVKAPSPSVYGFLITRYEPDIRTLDTLDWENMNTKDAADSLSYAVDTLALLHAHYVFHGDTAFRNIAVCDATQRPITVDLELSGSLRDEETNIMKLSRFMSGDFSSLAASLDMNINHLYQNESGLTSSTDRFNFMYEHIFLPYYDRLVQFGITPQDPLGLAYDNVVSRRLAEAVGDEGYWKHV